jgi:hypothetical protein
MLQAWSCTCILLIGHLVNVNRGHWVTARTSPRDQSATKFLTRKYMRKYLLNFYWLSGKPSHIPPFNRFLIFSIEWLSCILLSQNKIDCLFYNCLPVYICSLFHLCMFSYGTFIFGFLTCELGTFRSHLCILYDHLFKWLCNIMYYMFMYYFWVRINDLLLKRESSL